MGRSGGENGEPNVMRFRVERIVPADAVPYLTVSVPSGHYLMATADVNGPVTNFTYRPEQVLPHMDAINDAIASQRVYMVETDSTALNWPHNPDPRGYIDERILRAIVERQFAEDEAEPE